MICKYLHISPLIFIIWSLRKYCETFNESYNNNNNNDYESERSNSYDE